MWCYYATLLSNVEVAPRMKKAALIKHVYWLTADGLNELYDLPEKCAVGMYVWVDGKKASVDTVEVEVTMP